MGARPGSSPPTPCPSLTMFALKCQHFYRVFLDRLYHVADLLTDRPETKPPDPPSPQADPVVSEISEISDKSWGFSWALGDPTWTKKWLFQFFVKKKRRKVTMTFLQLRSEIFGFSALKF